MYLSNLLRKKLYNMQLDKTIETPSWDELFMRKVYLISTKSKDNLTKIGAVLVKDNIPLCEGYNGIPRKVDDNKRSRYERPEKYFWFSHAERNAIFHCARYGIATDGAYLYTQGLPCSDCCHAIINSGISKIIVHRQWEGLDINQSREKWVESTKRSSTMLQESGVEVGIFDMALNVDTVIDGKVYVV